MPLSTTRTVWVTGVTSGIGKACVTALALRGHKVIALGRRADRLDELKAQLPGCPVHTVACDVQDLEQIKRAIQELPEDFSQVDALVNNAGLMLGLGRFDVLSPAHMNAMLMTNCMGVLNNTSALLPLLRKSGCGQIVNITSIAAFYPYVTGHVYAATKAFVEHFGANLRTEVSGEGIRVTNIAPGRTNTEFHQVRAGADGQATPLLTGAPMLDPQDLAAAVLWVLEQPQGVSIQAIEMAPAGQSLSFR